MWNNMSDASSKVSRVSAYSTVLVMQLYNASIHVEGLHWKFTLPPRRLELKAPKPDPKARHQYFPEGQQNTE